MSWSGSTLLKKGTATLKAIAQIDAIELVGNDDCLDEREIASEAAKGAATAILTDTAVGNLEDTAIHVQLSGHCNPGNRPKKGWSNDFITVTVSQRPDVEE